MRKITLEQQLVASRPVDATNRAFVAHTMQAVRLAHGHETFDRVMRKTNVTKKEHLFMRLRHLPRVVVIGLLLSAVAAFSGTAYAAYRLWIQPTATVRSASQHEALIRLRNCDEYGGNSDMHIVLNTSSGINPAVAAKYIQAMCDIQAVQSWAMITFQGAESPNSRTDPSDILFPYSIQNMQGNTIQLHDGTDWRTIRVDSNTTYVAGGAIVARQAIKVGDTVAFVVDQKDSHVIRAIVKLELPFTYYNNSLPQGSFLTRTACTGDPKAWCTSAPASLDVLRSGEPGASLTATGNWYELQGTLVDHSTSGFTIKGTDGVLYTVPTTTDAIETFNTTHPYGGSITVEIGDVLDIMYRQPTTTDHKVVKANQLDSVELLLAHMTKQEADTPTNNMKYRY